MSCLCGKEMVLLGKIIPARSIIGSIIVWTCPAPDGCGRIYLEGTEGNIIGTWYGAEKNEKLTVLP